MEDHSYTDGLMQEQMEERQHTRQAIHPSPSPVPYSPQPLPHRNGSGHAHASYTRRHHSANVNQVSDTLRRRSTGIPKDEDNSISSDVDASFRFSGLDMPSTTSDDPLESHTQHHPSTNTAINNTNDHLLPHNYYHANAGVHHNVNNCLHQSLSNVTGHSPRQHSPTRRQHHPHGLRIQRAHTHSDAQPHRPSRLHATHDACDDDTASVASQRRRRSSFTPQHQLDRKNSRRRVTQNTPKNASTSSSAVPNRYYLSGKTMQTEWSSPTRQRRSRSTLPTNYLHQHGSDSSHGKAPKSKSSLADRDNHDHNPGNQHGNNTHGGIIVLPSISIPDHDDYRHNDHPSQFKPPAFPQRRACVQATNMFCSFGAFKWCVMIQIILVIPLFLYVFDAHAQKKHAKQQLQQYNEEHEHILNQMMWMDQAAKKLRHKHKKPYYEPEDPDSANPLDLVGADSEPNNNNNNNNFESYYAGNSATEDLRDSVHKLRGQMRDMQYRIQQNSKARITEKYGEGPIRVYIHPEAEDPVLAAAAAGPGGTPQEMTSEIALELFIEDTPHAVSTFLYQIERGHWNRVQMNWKTDTTILSKPGSSVTAGMGDWMQTSRLEFLEQFPIKHCEVVLVQQGQMGVLSLQINLVEVPFQEQEEVCIGRLLNDRLILPKARGYFMAEFATTSDASAKSKSSPRLPQPLPQSQIGEELTPPPHEPPPPVIDEDGEKFMVEAESEKLEAPPRQQRLRGRADAEDEEEEEEEDIGHQIVPPLEEPVVVHGVEDAY